jgi:hypothetical protein
VTIGENPTTVGLGPVPPSWITGIVRWCSHVGDLPGGWFPLRDRTETVRIELYGLGAGVCSRVGGWRRSAKRPRWSGGAWSWPGAVALTRSSPNAHASSAPRGFSMRGKGDVGPLSQGPAHDQAR